MTIEIIPKKKLLENRGKKQVHFIYSKDKLIGLFEKYQIPFDRNMLFHPFSICIPELYANMLIKSALTDKEKKQVRNLLIANKTDKSHPYNGVDFSFFNENTSDYDILKGLTRMYSDRVLISPQGSCAIHCPWCFRKPRKGCLNKKNLMDIFQYIQYDSYIEDVILTGGEPFLLSSGKLDFILRELRKISHVNIIRFHTRAPIVFPEIFNDNLLEVIGKYNLPRKPIYIVVQSLHYLELNDDVANLIYKIRKLGITVLNQAPILRNVNDEQETFNRWTRDLINIGIKPYYVILPIIRSNINEQYFVPYSDIVELVSSYSSKYDGLGRPIIIIPIMGKKLSSNQLKNEMLEKHGIHFRNTKAEIWLDGVF